MLLFLSLASLRLDRRGPLKHTDKSRLDFFYFNFLILFDNLFFFFFDLFFLNDFDRLLSLRFINFFLYLDNVFGSLRNVGDVDQERF